MDASLETTVRSAEGTVHLGLSGTISEHFDLGPHLKTALECRKLVIDVGGIRRINSAGVRNWITFLGQVPATTEVWFESLPIVMVEQANMILNFLGKARVRSLMAPYFCYACQDTDTKMITIDDGTFDVKDPKPPAFKCSRCQGALDFDDDEEGYFVFLKSAGGAHA